MRKEDKVRGFLVIILIIFIAININSINNFLSFHNDETIEFGHSTVIVPESWNTTDKLNSADEAKTENALTNGYIIIDHWDDWPEDKITSISEKTFKSMEDGGYKVLKNENLTLNGVEVSKQYFKNPSRDNDTVWTPVGVNYVFSKEDSNYTVQVHYFTDQDYKNETFLKEIDTQVENEIENIHNKDYNPVVSSVWHVVDTIKGILPH
ncbi:hypothetical protein [uncultured Methanobrevibacter sp.]|uniref:hypothetical protein n=1 Tax=uncultured Methanobrevibacter sp. TaxID=253161 RepID=UPI002619203D|nr:hypothetical protein [uncultured Methanobrevibacter sp.]